MPKSNNRPKKYAGVQQKKEQEQINAYFAKLAVRLISDDRFDRDMAWAELNSLRAIPLVASEPPLAEDDHVDQMNPIYTINPNFLTAEDAWRGTCEIYADLPDVAVPLRAPPEPALGEINLYEPMIFEMDDVPFDYSQWVL